MQVQMASVNSIIETGVDKLVSLTKEKGQISMEEAAKELGTSLTVVEEWANFLEEEGIINIQYRFTKPFLVAKKLTRTEITKKAKEFEGKKEGFVRRAEGTLTFLENEASKLKEVKSEVDKLKKDFGLEIDSVRKELGELEECQRRKVQLDKEVNSQSNETEKKISNMSQKITSEIKKYQEIIGEIDKEKLILDTEKRNALSLEENEKMLRQKIEDIKSAISGIDKKIFSESSTIKNAEAHLGRLIGLAERTKKELEEEKAAMEPLLARNEKQQKKISDIQKLIIEKLSKKKTDINKTKSSSEKMKDILDKKMGVVNLIDEVNRERNSLEKELTVLIKKAKSFNLASKSADLEKEMAKMEDKFREVDKKKSLFENQFSKLNSLFKSSK